MFVLYRVLHFPHPSIVKVDVVYVVASGESVAFLCISNVWAEQAPKQLFFRPFHMYRLLPPGIPDPERTVLRNRGEHVLTLRVLESHVIYLISVCLEVPLLLEFSVSNSVEPHNAISAACDEVSTAGVPAD